MNKRYAPWILLISILVFAGFACQAAPSLMTNRPRSAVTLVVTPPSSAQIPNTPVDMEYQDTLLTTLYERVNPGIVSIQVLGETGSSLGSGFVFDKEGHIITNYHVVEGAQDLEVDFQSGLKVRGKVIGNDLDSDLAVVKVDAPADALFP